MRKKYTGPAMIKQAAAFLRKHLWLSVREQLVIAAITLFLATGLFITFRSGSRSAGNVQSAYDYAEADSTFIRLSSGPAAGPEERKLLAVLNSMSKSDFIRIPGIGPVTAGKITAHRSKNGDFCSFESMLKISGIGPKRLEAVREYVISGKK